MPSIADRSTHFVIRLVNKGCTNRPFYHIVVQKNKRPQFKRIWDQVGVYDPVLNMKQEQVVSLDIDRLRYWITKRGAWPTKSLLELISLSGFFPIHPTLRLTAHRLQRAAREKAENEKKHSESPESAESSEDPDQTQPNPS